jgi:hypothetical protein
VTQGDERESNDEEFQRGPLCERYDPSLSIQNEEQLELPITTIG